MSVHTIHIEHVPDVLCMYPVLYMYIYVEDSMA
jgi:hypothetical protein